ncbi:MAG: hypothetical protein KAQ74_02540 [Dehalococcoidia bacterium]|nr:hypothetical protein [Dehalococcoidia bacterium]
MKRNKSEAEKRFSEDIERLLNGQEPDLLMKDADYARTLQFAQQLMSLREEPRPDFQRNLREGLLNRNELLVESGQSEYHPSLFQRLFGSPSLRMAVVSSFVILVAVGLVWRAGLLSPMMMQPSDEATMAVPDEEGAVAPSAMEEAPPQAPRVTQEGEAEEDYATGKADTGWAMPMSIRVYTEPSYAYGAVIDMSVVFENSGQETLSLDPFPPRITIRQEGTSNVVRTFVAGSSQIDLSPMESTQYSLKWDQRDSTGTQVAAGRYEVDIDPLELHNGLNAVPMPDIDSGVAIFEIVPVE